MLHLVGTVLPTTPIHQTDPNRDGNYSKTLKTYVFDTHQTRYEIPFVTGNSIRGQLRRAAAGIVLEALGKPVTRALFSVLTSGKASRKDVGMVPTTRATVDGGKNVFAGLFGGGGYMLPSRYSMGPLLPQVAWVDRALHHSLRAKMIPIEKLRYKRADDSYGNVPLTHDYILTSRDDVLAGKGQNVIENYEASYDAWYKEVVSGRVAKAKDKAEKEQALKEGKKVESNGKAISSDVAGFNLTEAIVPGLPLQFWLRFNAKASDAQIGLMLLAVRDWANDNVIGGASARGYGRFEATIALYDDDREVVGNIFNINDHVMSYSLSEGVKPWIDAADDALKALKVSDLEESYATNGAGV